MHASVWPVTIRDWESSARFATQQMQSEKDRLTIAGKLIQGVTFERILDDIRNNMDSSLERIHLTSRKDIANIERAYGL